MKVWVISLVIAVPCIALLGQPAPATEASSQHEVMISPNPNDEAIFQQEEMEQFGEDDRNFLEGVSVQPNDEEEGSGLMPDVLVP